MNNGRWTVGKAGEHHGFYVEDQFLGETVCDLYFLGEVTREPVSFVDAEDNARLIAAAPEMAEAISVAQLNARFISDPAMDGATDVVAIPLDDWDALLAALAKAEGKS